MYAITLKTMHGLQYLVDVDKDNIDVSRDPREAKEFRKKEHAQDYINNQLADIKTKKEIVRIR